MSAKTIPESTIQAWVDNYIDWKKKCGKWVQTKQKSSNPNPGPRRTRTNPDVFGGDSNPMYGQVINPSYVDVAPRDTSIHQTISIILKFSSGNDKLDLEIDEHYIVTRVGENVDSEIKTPEVKIEVGDRIRKVNGSKLSSINQFNDFLLQRKGSTPETAPVSLEIEKPIEVKCKLSKDGTLKDRILINNNGTVKDPKKLKEVVNTGDRLSAIGEEAFSKNREVLTRKYEKYTELVLKFFPDGSRSRSGAIKNAIYGTSTPSSSSRLSENPSYKSPDYLRPGGATANAAYDYSSSHNTDVMGTPPDYVNPDGVGVGGGASYGEVQQFQQDNAKLEALQHHAVADLGNAPGADGGGGATFDYTHEIKTITVSKINDLGIKITGFNSDSSRNTSVFYISNVKGGSAAEEVGLKNYMRVYKINNQNTDGKTTTQVKRLIKESDNNVSFVVSVKPNETEYKLLESERKSKREGESVVELYETPKKEKQIYLNGKPEWEIKKVSEGWKITKVDPTVTEAFKGDIITKINNINAKTKLLTSKSVLNLLKMSAEVTLLSERM